MNSVLTNSSIVIVAHDVNLSIFKPLWLIKADIFRKEELEGNIIITPAMVQIPAEKFEFVVLPDRIQMTIGRKYKEAEADIIRVLGGIVKILPHTPYTAIGLNFNYLTAPEAENIFGSWERKLFSSKFADKVPEATERNARFGSYFSFDILEARLKVDIKPVNAEGNINQLCESWCKGQELVRLSLNFHNDVKAKENPEAYLLQKLNKWSEALDFSEKIVEMIYE